MFNAKTISAVAVLLATGLSHAQAQAPRFTGLGQVWYTQMMDNKLRLNSYTGPYQSNARFQENGFYFRRVELKAAGTVGETLDWEFMIDPTISGTDTVLQDIAIRYKLPNNIEIRMGQFKPLQTLEGTTSSSDILFAERSMLGRQFGDPRDRGVVASIGFGDSNAFNGRFHFGVFQGAAKANDANAQKDLVARLDMNYGRQHYFGLYTMQGSTNLSDKEGTLHGLSFGEYGPEAAKVFDNKDKSSNVGLFYRFQTSNFHASFEAITGLIGRRYASLGATGGASVNSNRKHLDQKFIGYVGTFGYTFDKHSILARYDYMDYNSGSDWYGNVNPYKTAEGDFTPKYTEITVGYNYAFMPDRFRAANIKLNYIMRSKNFLRPMPGTSQVGEQGGDSIVAAFQFAF